jgi:malonate transporter
MGDVLAITGPIFALIAAGWLMTRGGIFSPADIRALGRYVVWLALPALIIRAVATSELGAIVHFPYLAAYLAGSLAVLAFGYRLARRAGRGGTAASFSGMGMSCANSGFMGFPALVLAMPAVADRALAMNMTVENLVILPAVLFLAETGSGGNPARTIRRVATSPILVALLVGLGLALTGLRLPGVAERSVDLVARSSTAVSLLVIGGMLVGVPRAAPFRVIAWLVAGKLLLHPLSVAAAFAVLGWAGVAVDPVLARAGVLMAAMPAMGVYPVLAAEYGEGPTAAAAMLAMTLASFFTVGALLWLYAAFPA